MTSLPSDPKKLHAINQATIIDQLLVETRSWPKLLKLSIQRQFLRYYWMKPPLWRVLLRALTNSQRMLPAFLNLGPARSGTTLLSDYIMQHPCVVLPLAKEIGLSVNPTLQLVQAQFPTLREQREIECRHGMAITGYCTPAVPNLLFPYALAAVVSKLKIVCILRNPVERTFSHWRWEMFCSNSVKNDPLWKKAPDFPEVARLEIEAARSHAVSGFTFLSGANCGGYLQNSIYLPFLKTLFKFYDKSDALFIDSDEFFADPTGVAKQVYAFLGLPEFEPQPLQLRNASPSGQMGPDTRAALAEFFAPLNQQLYEYIGRDFGWK